MAWWHKRAAYAPLMGDIDAIATITTITTIATIDIDKKKGSQLADSLYKIGGDLLFHK